MPRIATRHVLAVVAAVITGVTVFYLLPAPFRS